MASRGFASRAGGGRRAPNRLTPARQAELEALVRDSLLKKSHSQSVHGLRRLLQSSFRFTASKDGSTQDVGLADFTEGVRRFLNGISDEEIGGLFRSYDADGSGRLSLREFSDALLAADASAAPSGSFVRGASSDQKLKGKAARSAGLKPAPSPARAFGSGAGGALPPRLAPARLAALEEMARESLSKKSKSQSAHGLRRLLLGVFAFSTSSAPADPRGREDRSQSDAQEVGLADFTNMGLPFPVWR